ncbi:MAG: site-specific integrase [Armatimonadota bacterium]|nr:site-specific integrase [Armatimonadota bacterium]MDR7410344.1 site-specific integrase [Armatimonadota bacterium]
MGRDERGRPVRRWVYGRTRQEVVQALGRLREQRRLGKLPAPGRLTVGEFLRAWLADVVAPSVRPKTLESYGLAVRRVVRVLGPVRLSELGPHHVQHLLRRLEEQAVGPRARHLTFEALRAALNHAKRMGLMESNPCTAIKPPRARPRQFRTWTAEEARRFLDVAQQDRYYGVFALALFCGLRRGEALGLRWSDVDLNAGVARITRQLQEIGGEITFPEPKSAASKRLVYLPGPVVEALQRRLTEAQQEGTYSPDGLVFTDTQGGPVRPSNLLRRHFYPLVEKAEVPRIRFHDLRHTSATLALQAGVHPRTLAGLLGHSRPALTMQTYAHVIPLLEREAAERIARVLDNNLTT